MVTLSSRARRLVVAGLATAAVGFALAPAGLDALAPSSGTTASGSDCVDGVVPLNPYIVNCNLPARADHVVGAAPDAGAIIACRHNLTCLSYYVNYPGTLVVPGYRP
ncbi:hypothetical protein [Mycolicibacterium sp.]|uniref:hypothetical protein n=1 Tax=Mycolicibacterium sp. TaxID=2320850 RepID=UPI001A2DA76E|nr:hypothetical protein [Mycolicibacterium sp.]MBJ7337351.1 hypothetical protein [Mycolicibacterium sp.]